MIVVIANVSLSLVYIVTSATYSVLTQTRHSFPFLESLWRNLLWVIDIANLHILKQILQLLHILLWRILEQWRSCVWVKNRWLQVTYSLYFCQWICRGICLTQYLRLIQRTILCILVLARMLRDDLLLLIWYYVWSSLQVLLHHIMKNLSVLLCSWYLWVAASCHFLMAVFSCSALFAIGLTSPSQNSSCWSYSWVRESLHSS